MDDSFRSLQGHLLVAGPTLLDTNFFRCVVLVTEHGPEGAMGVVLNRPTPLLVSDAVPPLADLVEPDDAVHVGGPVQPEAVLALAEFLDPEAAAAIVLDRLGFLSAEADPAELVAVAARTRVFSGYTGWGAGQLEAELAEESWIVEPARVEDVFAPAEELWHDVLTRKGGPYRLLATMPEDPTLN